MTRTTDPVGELHPAFSSPGAAPTAWGEARRRLQVAKVYWLSTVRADGRPHVTPVISVWLEDALYFCTGAGERKTRNLVHNPHCIITTGCNTLDDGLDLVVEGAAAAVIDLSTLQRIAHLYETKYGSTWHFDVRDGAFYGTGGNRALVYRVAPTVVFGFGKGEFSQTRWRMGPPT